MTDTRLLKRRIRESGLKKTHIASRLGLSYQGYLKKENGEHFFTSKEISILIELLNLSTDDVMQIFFANKVDK